MCHKVTYRAAHKRANIAQIWRRQVLILLHLFQSDLLLGTSGLLPTLFRKQSFVRLECGGVINHRRWLVPYVAMRKVIPYSTAEPYASLLLALLKK